MRTGPGQKCRSLDHLLFVHRSAQGVCLPTHTNMDNRPSFAEPERLNTLGLAPELHALLRTSLINYQRHARLVIRLEEHDFPHVRFTARQVAPAVNGWVLTEAEIIERVTEVLRPLSSTGWKPQLNVSA